MTTALSPIHQALVYVVKARFRFKSDSIVTGYTTEVLSESATSISLEVKDYDGVPVGTYTIKVTEHKS